MNPFGATNGLTRPSKSKRSTGTFFTRFTCWAVDPQPTDLSITTRTRRKQDKLAGYRLQGATREGSWFGAHVSEGHWLTVILPEEHADCPLLSRKVTGKILTFTIFEACFLSLLVVMPPCHAWLSLLVVTLTGSGKWRRILSGRTQPGPFQPVYQYPGAAL